MTVPPIQPLPVVMTTEEVAEVLRCSVDTVQRYVHTATSWRPSGSAAKGVSGPTTFWTSSPHVLQRLRREIPRNANLVDRICTEIGSTADVHLLMLDGPMSAEPRSAMPRLL